MNPDEIAKALGADEVVPLDPKNPVADGLRVYRERSYRVRRRVTTQDAIIDALKDKIEQVLMRPGMYTTSLPELRGLLVGFSDALALACSGYKGGFLHGEIPQIDETRSDDWNQAEILSAVKRILVRVPVQPEEERK